jgi:4-hydroxy-tetrahydrodipicolinate reductase
MLIKVLVNGAKGRMGRVICKEFEKLDYIKIIAKSDSKNELRKYINSDLLKFDIAIDFTSSNCVYSNALDIINANIRPVIGTSGITYNQLQKLKQLCKIKNLGGIIASNFSIGAILMMKYAEFIAKYFAKTEIIEYHHDKKDDIPSSTAKETLQLIKSSNQSICDIFTGQKVNKNSKILIHSIRLPGFISCQDILCGSIGETLTIRHNIIDRKCFINGVVFACKKVMDLTNLEYGLNSILGKNIK